MAFEKVQSSKLTQYEKLFQLCFPKAHHLNVEYLNWLYFKNPEGPVVGFDFIENDQVVAHYVCIPVVYNIEGENIKGLLSLNTATAPQFQGKGLFTQLAQRTYDEAKGLGLQFVIGVANANSTPGFVRKLEFDLISPLQVFGFSPFTTRYKPNPESHFSRNWTASSLGWRLTSPMGKYKRQDKFIVARTGVPGLSVYSNPFLGDELKSFALPNEFIRPLGIFLGYSRTSSVAIPIPDFLKPSPLNFIYRPLAGEKIDLRNATIHLDFLDFDAY